MKGFIFSTEAIASLVIVILVLGVFSYSSNTQIVDGGTKQIHAQANEVTGIYFNLNYADKNSLSPQQYCTTAAAYNYTQKKILDTNSCRWYE